MQKNRQLQEKENNQQIVFWKRNRGL